MLGLRPLQEFPKRGEHEQDKKKGRQKNRNIMHHQRDVDTRNARLRRRRVAVLDPSAPVIRYPSIFALEKTIRGTVDGLEQERGSQK